jgi:hypothetical protein
MSSSIFFYAQTSSPSITEEITASSILEAFKHLTLAKKLNIAWIHQDANASTHDRFATAFEVHLAFIADIRAGLRHDYETGKVIPPVLSQWSERLSFADIRNSLDKKVDERTIALYDELLRERLNQLPESSYEERAITQAYILRNILKRKRFFVEARIQGYIDGFETSLKKQKQVLKIKIRGGRTNKSKAIHTTTYIAYLSIAVDLLNQTESAFRERGFRTLTTRLYVARMDYYTDLILAKWHTIEWVGRKIWFHTSKYGADLRQLLLTTLVFLIFFSGLFFIFGEYASVPINESGKAVLLFDTSQSYGTTNHPMLYNYNGKVDLMFHYVFLTIKLMAFRVETGFIAVTLSEKMLGLGAEFIGLILFWFLLVLVNKKMIA